MACPPEDGHPSQYQPTDKQPNYTTRAGNQLDYTTDRQTYIAVSYDLVASFFSLLLFYSII